MGAVDALVRAGAIRFARMRSVGPGFDYSAALCGDGFDLRGLCLRRAKMDAVMIDLARSHRGVTFRERTRVVDLEIDCGEIVGVRAEDAAGAHRFHAPLVIGADGMRSTVAQIASARIDAFAREDVPCARAYYYAYFSGVDFRAFGDDLITEYGDAEGAANLACRCDDGLVVAATAFDGCAMRTFRSDLAANLWSHLNASCAVSALLRGARIEGKVLSSGLLANTYRDPVAAGALLLGDAGLHVDPLFGQGHSLALISAEILGEMAPRWFGARTGRAIGAAAMAEFREARDRALMPYYRPTVRASADLSLDRTTRLAHRVANRERWAADEMVRYAQMAATGNFPSFRLARAIALEARALARDTACHSR
jgi:flavin-dependent dehydrogenase